MGGLGYGAIALTFLASLYVTIAALIALRRRNDALLESVRNGIWFGVACATVALGLLLVALLARDYGIQYVHEHTSNQLPIGYTLAALWAGQEGSLLLWLWLVSLAPVLQTRHLLAQRGQRGPAAIVATAGTQAFLALVLLAVANPFALSPTVPAEGQGLNPLLQNFWMTIHPPVVFAGYAAYTMPFALAIGALVSRQLDESWLLAVRRWALLAWGLLSAGIIMGAWWAYLELGWGGYWGWDPVENSSLVPWLTGTALLHSLMMQRRRGVFRRWNLWLIVLTFLLCFFATFVTRSGIISSVHAFGQSPVGYYFLAFIILCFAAFIGLFLSRREEISERSDPHPLLSRESGLLATNLLFIGTAGVILLGTLFPTLATLVQGRQAALDVSFYERTAGPLGQVIVLLLGICPWLNWGGGAGRTLAKRLLPPMVVGMATAALLVALGYREPLALLSFATCGFVITSIASTFYRDIVARQRATQEGWLQATANVAAKSRVRYGAYGVHLGVVLMVMGITGSSVYSTEIQAAVAEGERLEVQGYTLVYKQLLTDDSPLRQRTMAVLDVTRGGRKIATLSPSKEYFWNTEQWVTEVAIRSTLQEDLYVILAGVEQDGLASFRVLVKPLVVWLWIGGAMLLIGGAIAWWPRRSEGRS